MAGLTQVQAQTQLDNAIDALNKAYENQSYSIEGRSLSRQNIADLQDAIDYWDNKVKELDSDSSGLIVSQVAPEYDY
jgi:hypothetical protein